MEDFEKKLYEAFGFEPPAEDVAEEQPTEPETAPEAEEPAEEHQEEGGKEQEAADPALDSDDTPAQDKATNARNAARRRKAERDAAVEEAVNAEREKNQAQMKRVFERMGFVRDGKPIENLEDLEAYMDEADEKKLQTELKAGKLTPETLQGIVAREVGKAVKAAPAEAGTTDAQIAFQTQMAEELAQIQKYDPGVRSLSDLKELDRADAFMDAVVNHGHSFIDAYKFVYADRIAAKEAAEKAQRTADKTRSKDHLQSSAPRGNGDLHVPPEVMSMYKKLNPKATADEIRKHYNRTQKGE